MTAAAAATPTIDIVIVAWNHNDTLPDCLAAIAACDQTGWRPGRVVVIDNASTTPVALAAPPGLQLTILRNRDNLGFAAACNQGAADSDADLLLFLNPDTQVGRHSLRSATKGSGVFFSAEIAPENGDVDACLHQVGAENDAEKKTPDPFAVGLPLVDQSGQLQATCGPPVTARRLFNQVMGLARIAPSWFPGMRFAVEEHRQTRPVGFASGAALLVRRWMFEALGGFNSRFVVYLEDADLCARAEARGWPTWLVSTDPVVHRGGWAHGGHRAWRLAQSWRSTIRYARCHYPPVTAACLAMSVLVGAPLARLTRAAASLDGRECAAVAGAWITLIRLLTSRSATPSRATLTTTAPPLRQESPSAADARRRAAAGDRNSP